MNFIHINVHFAVGMVIASISNYFLHLNLFEFSLIVLASFLCDFDVIFSKFAKDHNHRMLISHSIIPGIIISIIGLLVNWIALIIAGFSYLIHVSIDTFDWGTNYFGFHKSPWGLKLLISETELENLEEILSKFKIRKSFFDFRYYQTKAIILIEILIVALMFITIFLFAMNYILITVIYVPFSLFHLLVYLNLRKIENH